MQPLNISLTSVSCEHPRFSSLGAQFSGTSFVHCLSCQPSSLPREAAVQRWEHYLCFECYSAQLWLFSFQAPSRRADMVLIARPHLKHRESWELRSSFHSPRLPLSLCCPSGLNFLTLQSSFLVLFDSGIKRKRALGLPAPPYCFLMQFSHWFSRKIQVMPSASLILEMGIKKKKTFTLLFFLNQFLTVILGFFLKLSQENENKTLKYSSFGI